MILESRIHHIGGGYTSSAIEHGHPRATVVETLLEKYQKTSVDFLPLEEIFTLRNGYTPSTRQAEFWDNGTIPFVTMEDIRKYGRRLDKFCQFVTEIAVKGGKFFPESSFIISTTATIGEHAFVTVPYISNQRFICLTLKPEFESLLDRGFIFFYLYILGNWCRRNVNKGTFASVRMGAFRQFPFPIPPLNIQKEIVSILEKFEDSSEGLLGSLKKELALREKQYTYYRAQLLKFPKEGEDLKKTLSSSCPRHVIITQKQHNDPHALLPQTLLHKFQSTPVIWKTIGELGEVVSGKGLTKAELLDSGPVGCIHYGEIYTKYGTSATKTVSFCTEETAKKLTKVYPRDLIIAKGATSKMENIGRGFAWLGEEIITVGGETIVIRLNPEYDPLFLAYYTQVVEFRDQISRYAVGASFKRIVYNRLTTLKIPLPPLEVQKEIVSILEEKESLKESLKEEIHLREKQYKYYRSQLLNFQNPSHYPLNNLKTL